MKVFIGWSGERSKALAEALREWLPLVLHYVEPWLSEADVGAGERWAQAVATELEASNFGITCVTRENAGSPWILFEAGALTKSMQVSRVIPLLLDLEFSDLTGPLAQFQAKKVERSGLSDVLQSINEAADHEVPEDRARQLFDALWPELEKKVEQIPDQPAGAKHNRPQHEILEELVTSVRSLDSRFREVESLVAMDPARGSRHRRLRYHPMMLEEFPHMISGSQGDPIGILIAASAVSEELPWLYELGLEAYRAIRNGDAEEELLRLNKAAECIAHAPFPVEEYGIDMRALHLLLHETEYLMHGGRMDYTGGVRNGGGGTGKKPRVIKSIFPPVT